jgi:hypothetical protein
MTLHRSVILTIVVAMASAHQAQAQFGGMPGSPGMEGPSFGGPPACLQLMTLRDEYQKNGIALLAASKNKAEPAEACKLFKVFLASEAKFIQELTENSTTCGVPPQTLKQFQDGHGKASVVGKQVCEAAERQLADPQRSTTFGRPFLFDGILPRPGR